jgi:ribokinase
VAEIGGRRIVVVGAHCPGLLIQVSSVPRPGETVLGWDLAEPLDGGKATNQAVAAARVGAPVSFVTVVGDDERGQALVSLLADEGIDGQHVALLPGATDIGVVLLASDGIPAIVSLTDRSWELTASLVSSAAKVLSDASVVVCQLEAPTEAAIAAFRFGRATGATTVLNPAPAPNGSLDAELVTLTDVLIPNESEAASLAGREGAPGDLAKSLRADLGVQTVIVTAGPLGAFACLADGRQLHVPAPVVTAVDTTGAGDSLIGAFAAALHFGFSLQAALAFGVEVSSNSVTKPGSIPSYPRLSSLAGPGLDLGTGTRHAIRNGS